MSPLPSTPPRRRLRAVVAGAVVALIATMLIPVAVPVSPASAAPLVVDPNDGPSVVSVSVAPGRLDLFTVGSDRALHHRAFRDGKWSGWEDLGGSLASPPAVAWFNADHFDVFARGTDNALWHTWYSGGTWRSWSSLGGSIASAPAVGSWRPGHLDVFARGTDNALWHAWLSPGGWQPMSSLGGSIASAPAVGSYANEHFDVFARGTDNTLQHIYFLGSWREWSSLGGSIVSRPTVGSWRAGHFDVFARGSDNTLQHAFLDQNGWHRVSGMGGSISSAPTVVSWGSGHFDVFARGTDNTLQHIWAGGGVWQQWSSLGGALASAPSVTAGPNVAMDAFATDANGDVVRAYIKDGAWKTVERAFGQAPALAIQRNSRTSVLQMAPAAGETLGPVTYSYVDNIGRLRYGHQADPGMTGSVQWATINPGDAYSGQPAVHQQPDGRLQIAGHRIDGDVVTGTQKDAGRPVWNGWTDVGGWLRSDITSATLPDGRAVLFGVDADGVLFAKQQRTVNGGYGTWRNVGDLRLAAAPATATTQSGLQLVARDVAGHLRTAEFGADAALSPWTDLGAAGSTGSPAVVVYPGSRMRIFVRSAVGDVQTKMSNFDGTWPEQWQSTGDFPVAGSPAAILDPALGRTAVVARGTDNEMYVTWETEQGSGQWGGWRRALGDGDQPVSDLAATDPTVAPVNTGNGATWFIVFRTANDATRVYERQFSGQSAASRATQAARAVSGAAGRTVRVGKVTFSATTLPKPPDAR